MCAVCGTVCCGFGGVSVCYVWGSLVWVWGSESVLCVGQIGVGLWGVSVQQVALWCVCVGGGLCACWHCVVVSEINVCYFKNNSFASRRYNWIFVIYDTN